MKRSVEPVKVGSSGSAPSETPRQETFRKTQEKNGIRKKPLVPITILNYKEEFLKTNSNYKTYEEIYDIVSCWSLEDAKQFLQDLETNPEDKESFSYKLKETRKIKDEGVDREFLRRTSGLLEVIKYRDNLFHSDKIDKIKKLEELSFVQQEDGSWIRKTSYPNTYRKNHNDFYTKTNIFVDDIVRVTGDYGDALENMEGRVINIYTKGEFEDDDHYLTVEFKVQAYNKDTFRLHTFNLFQETVPFKNLKLIARWDSINHTYTTKNLNKWSPVLKRISETSYKKAYKLEFPSNFML